MNDIKKISAEQFRACQNDPEHCVIDVRDRQDFAAGSEAQVCWPLNEINSSTLSSFVKEQKLDPNKTLVLLCTRGMRATQAAEKLRPLLPNPIAVVEGGHTALAASSGEKVMSIERQVRIAAGSLILLGLVGAALINPALILLSAFVAAGLIFTGVTDSCALGMLMMKMPWNKKNRNK